MDTTSVQLSPRPIRHVLDVLCFRVCWLVITGFALSACGGGSSTDGMSAGTGLSSGSAVVEERQPSTDNTAAGTSDKAVRKVSIRAAVYRFFNRNTTAHFYTNDETEKNNVLATMPQFSFDGVAFQASVAFSPGLSPVYRFYNTATGVHFYTINEAEKNNIQATRPQFVFEGTAYHASQFPGKGFTPLYRFYVPARGFHFYTASEAEKNNIQATLASTYTYEGIGYYVLTNDWTSLKLPHSGVPFTQCYQAGSNTLTSCGNSGPQALDNQQDGMRNGYNPMAYETVNYFAGMFWFAYPTTQCVRDAVTGLVWEGKEASGPRSDIRLLTHLGDGSTNDTSAYVAAINASNLCGFNDWRVPSLLELTTLNNLSSPVAPGQDGTWFPNTSSSYHWTSDISPSDNRLAWIAQFAQTGLANAILRTSGYPVRLVRGNMFPGGQRFSYSTLAYGADASNNLVNDAWTGLQWRRCLEGQTWSGTTCTGFAPYFTHEQALAYVGDPSRTTWRMPNARELDSLLDRTRASGPRIDPVAFVGADGSPVWSTTPLASAPSNAYYTNFSDYSGTFSVLRSDLARIRMIRILGGWQ